MNKLEALTSAYGQATGKWTLPATGSSKRLKIEGLATKIYRDWQVEPGIEWDSLYQVIGAGTVSATDTFDLDTDINFISTQEGRELNGVRVLHADGINYTDFTVVKPAELYQNRHHNCVAKIADGQIKFSKPFIDTDITFGGTIQVPAIIKLDDLVNDTDEVLIDNPEWYPAQIAAEYALTDRQLNYLYSDLLDIANDRLKGMIGRNSSGNSSTNTGVDYFATLGNVGNSYQW